MPTNNYDKRMKAVVKRIENADISEENKQLIFNFKRDLEVQDYSKARIYKLLTYLKIIGEHIDYNFENATKGDIKDTIAWVNKRDLADASKTDYRIILKQFYKWLNDGEYPDKVEWISTTVKKSNNTLPKDVLTEEDIQKLIKTATNTRDRALISMLWETGARMGELIDLTIGDIEDQYDNSIDWTDIDGEINFSASEVIFSEDDDVTSGTTTAISFDDFGLEEGVDQSSKTLESLDTAGVDLSTTAYVGGKLVDDAGDWCPGVSSRTSSFQKLPLGVRPPCKIYQLTKRKRLCGIKPAGSFFLVNKV